MKVWQVIARIKANEHLVEINMSALDKAHPDQKPIYAQAVMTAENEIERLRNLEVNGA